MESMCWTLFEGKNPVTVVLEHMCPGAQYTVQGYTLNDVTWNSTDMPKPTEEAFNSVLKLLVEKKQRERIWKPQRLAAYPPHPHDVETSRASVQTMLAQVESRCPS